MQKSIDNRLDIVLAYIIFLKLTFEDSNLIMVIRNLTVTYKNVTLQVFHHSDFMLKTVCHFFTILHSSCTLILKNSKLSNHFVPKLFWIYYLVLHLFVVFSGIKELLVQNISFSIITVLLSNLLLIHLGLRNKREVFLWWLHFFAHYSVHFS